MFWSHLLHSRHWAQEPVLVLQLLPKINLQATRRIPYPPRTLLLYVDGFGIQKIQSEGKWKAETGGGIEKVKVKWRSFYLAELEDEVFGVPSIWVLKLAVNIIWSISNWVPLEGAYRYFQLELPAISSPTILFIITLTFLKKIFFNFKLFSKKKKTSLTIFF